jgi:hypothetical protein
MIAAKSTTVAISWGSKRATHRSALRNGKARFAIPGIRFPASFTSVTILSDPVRIAAQYARASQNTRHITRFASLGAKQVALVTLVVLREVCQSSRGIVDQWHLTAVSISAKACLMPKTAMAIAAQLMHTAAAQLPVTGYENIQAWFARVQALEAWKKSGSVPQIAQPISVCRP